MSSQKLPSVLQVDQMLRDQVLVDRAAVRRQAHQLVLAAVDLEAAVVGERPSTAARANAETAAACVSVDPVAAADADGGRAPLADAVERQDRGLVERAREERAGRVALVMIGEDERRLEARRRGPRG